jgi:hypothetical protein
VNTVGLTQEQLDQACVNEQTELPAGLIRPKPCAMPGGKFVPETQRVTPYSMIAIASLQQETIKFVGQIFDFIDNVNEQHQKLSEKRSDEIAAAKSDAEKEKVRLRDIEQSSQLMEKQIADYDRQFRETAILLRKEMLSRLPVQEQKADDLVLYNVPTNPLGMKKVANNLKDLAKKLCPR